VKDSTKGLVNHTLIVKKDSNAVALVACQFQVREKLVRLLEDHQHRGLKLVEL
jgi:hypothetical protein